MLPRTPEISPTKISNLCELASTAPNTNSAGKKVRMQEYADALAVPNASCWKARQNAVLSEPRNFRSVWTGRHSENGKRIRKKKSLRNPSRDFVPAHMRDCSSRTGFQPSSVLTIEAIWQAKMIMRLRERMSLRPRQQHKTGRDEFRYLPPRESVHLLPVQPYRSHFPRCSRTTSSE